MNARLLSKLRASRRGQGGGAVMFVVSMTLAVLAAVGLYALRAASTEVKTSGFERQNAQTHYLSEYGVLGATQEVNTTKAQLYLGLMVTKPDTGCQSLRGLPPPPPLVAGPLSNACRRMGSSELAAGNGYGGGWSNPTLVPYTTSVPGSLGPSPLAGDFYVELTDPTFVQPPAGYDLKLGLCFVQMTVSSTGVTQPILAAGLDQALFGSEGLETARARITGGPVRCAQ
jgi:hypothetical protein